MEAFWGFHKNHFSRIFNVYCGEFLLLGKLLLSSVVLFVLLGFGFVGSAAADATMWSQVYGGPTYYSARAMVATSDGGYAIAGRTGVNNNDFWLIKTDEFGYMEWNQTYGGTYFDYGNTMVKTADGGYAMVGETRALGFTSAKLWLVKTNETGFIPEHPSFILSSLLMTTTLVIVIYKKKPFNRPQKAG